MGGFRLDLSGSHSGQVGLTGSCEHGKDDQLYSLFFWDVKQRRLVVTDVSGQRIGPIFKGQASRMINFSTGTQHITLGLCA